MACLTLLCWLHVFSLQALDIYNSACQWSNNSRLIALCVTRAADPIRSSVCSDPSVFHLFSRAFDSQWNERNSQVSHERAELNVLELVFPSKLRPFNPVTQFHPSTGETRNPRMASRFSFCSLPRYEFNYFY